MTSNDTKISPLTVLKELIADINPDDLLLGWQHPIYLKHHRAGLISRRVQLLALVFAVLAPTWGVIDWILLPWPDWGLLASGRIAAAGVFLWLARPRRSTTSLKRALTELAILLISAPGLYLLSVLVLPSDGARSLSDLG